MLRKERSHELHTIDNKASITWLDCPAPGDIVVHGDDSNSLGIVIAVLRADHDLLVMWSTAPELESMLVNSMLCQAITEIDRDIMNDLAACS